MDVVNIIDDAIKAAQNIGKNITLDDINALGVQQRDALCYKFEQKEITIIPIGDNHFGHKACNLELLGAQIKYIATHKDCYTILLGDLAEIATKTSIGQGSYGQYIGSEDQLRLLYKILKPLADAGKILGAVVGNHEVRAMNVLDFNPMSAICERLEVPYLGYQGYLVLDVGGHKHSVMVFHGKGGSSTPAGKLNAMYKLRDIATVDLYLVGHTHTKMYDKQSRFQVNKETGAIDTITAHFVTCGSTLNYWDNYSEMKALPPEELGVVAITLSDKIKVSI